MSQINITPEASAPPLTAESYLDSLPADMQEAVLGLLASKIIFNHAVEAVPSDRPLLELYSFAVAKAIAGADRPDYLDAMINHARIMDQISSESSNDLPPSTNPRSGGVCPVCHGSTRRDAGSGPYRQFSHGYRAEDNSCLCDNCGGQYMYSSPTGRVSLRPDGSSCHHEYRVEQYSNRSCLINYVCPHCGDRYEIDSGD